MSKKTKKLSAREISVIKLEYNPDTEIGGLNALSSKYKISKKQLREILGLEVPQKVGLKVSPKEYIRENSKVAPKVSLAEKPTKRCEKDKKINGSKVQHQVGQEVVLGENNNENSIINKVGLKVRPSSNKTKDVNEEVAITSLPKEGLEERLSITSSKEAQVVNDNLKFLSEFINLFNGNIDTLKASLGIVENQKLSNQLQVHLPVDIESNFKTSIRVNKVVWEMFKQFCDENKQFKQKELLSQALLNMINAHK